MSRAAPLFLLAALIALAGLVWMASGGGDDTAAPAVDDGERWDDEALDAAGPRDPGDGGPTRSRVRPRVPEGPEPLVPRVLPPDAALEDIRDALSAKDPVALDEAYARIARLAAQSTKSLQALQRQIVKTDDPAIRGVAIVATCDGGSETALRFAAARLMKPKARGVGDIVGSLAALLRNVDVEVEVDDESLALSQLGGLAVRVGAAPSTDYAQKAIVFFLDHTDAPGDETGDVVELCIRSIRRAPSLAALLVDAGRRRAYVAALPASDWARIRSAALAQSLDDETRAAFAE